MARSMVTDPGSVRTLRRAGGTGMKRRESEDAPGERKVYRELLDQARLYYEALDRFRRERRRTRNYVEGDQWCELIPNVKDRFGNSMIKEEDFIRQDGRIPFKQNLLGLLVNNIVGQYRKNPFKSSVTARAREKQKVSEMLSNAVQSALNVNRTEVLDPANLREFAISGFCAGKVTYGWIPERRMPDVRVQNRNPNYMFFNTPISDPRIDPELTMIGEFYDLSIEQVVSAFAKNRSQEERIREMYSGRAGNEMALPGDDGLKPDHMDNLDFYSVDDPSKCRVYEIWTYEMEWVTYVHDYLNGSYTRTYLEPGQVAALNRERIRLGTESGIPEEEIALMECDRIYEGTWRVRYLTPQGECLMEADTPYMHGKHPYVLTLHPLVDGHVYGTASMVIDQQRFINRLILLVEAVVGASAKNLLMVPEDCIPDNMDLNDYAEAWTRVNGVIVYKAKPGVNAPAVLSANTVNTDANTLLQLQMQLVNQISGVNEAMQGIAPKSGTPSSLYAQQAENSSVNIADMMAMFGSFKEQRDMKVLMVLMQYYTEKRYLRVSGQVYRDVVDEYDPSMVPDLADVELVISASTDTPVYRQIKDNFLMQMFQMNAIPVEILLANSSLQGTDIILNQLRKSREEAAKQQQMMEQAMAQQAGTVQGAAPAQRPMAA